MTAALMVGQAIYKSRGEVSGPTGGLSQLTGPGRNQKPI